MSQTAKSAQSKEVSPSEVRQWLAEGKAVMVDVREGDERARMRIEGTTSMPMSRFDAGSLPRAEKIVVHCHAGARSAEAAARCAAQGIDDVYSMTGGIKGWESAGLPVQRTAGVPISIMRQVQITAGLIVLIFSVLAVTVSMWFALGAAFIGAGLTFAGASGFCGMAAVLAKMPWNRALRAGG